MKVFAEDDLIFWSNRREAVKGKQYYFANTIKKLNESIKKNEIHHLVDIIDDSFAYPFTTEKDAYSCILPVDVVEEV